MGAGATTITASIASDPNFNPVSPQQKLLTVIKNNQVILFDPIATRYVDGPPFTLSATSTSGLPVTFVSDNPAVAEIVGNSVTLHSAGQAVITASVSPDLNYIDAISVNKTLTVIKYDQSISFDALIDAQARNAEFARFKRTFK